MFSSSSEVLAFFVILLDSMKRCHLSRITTGEGGIFHHSGSDLKVEQSGRNRTKEHM